MHASSTTLPPSHLLELLDNQFNTWWAGFLQAANSVLKQFRAFGDDEGQLVALALAAKAGRSADRSNFSSLCVEMAHPGCSLSEIAVLTGCPLETTRRTLKRMLHEGFVRRHDKYYSMTIDDKLLTAGASQAEALARLMPVFSTATWPGSISGCLTQASKAAAATFWSAVLCYCANLRRRVTKGAYLSCLIAGMIQVERQVRDVLILSGRATVSRAEYNHVAISMAQPLISLQETAIIAGESAARVQAAVRHAVDLGLGTVPERGIFRYSIGASAVPDDSQAYTRGVRETLAELVAVFCSQEIPN